MPMGMTIRMPLFIMFYLADGRFSVGYSCVYIIRLITLSYRRGGLELLVLTVMGNSYGLKVWSE